MLYSDIQLGEMVPAPIVIKLKPVQTKRLIASTLQQQQQQPQKQQIITTSKQNEVKLTIYDSRIAERTPIDELKAGKHRLPVWADGLFEVTPVGQPRRRRKLTHLTQEEKILRRKLKNRVAAQNARDKKKTESEGLKTENDDLRALVKQLRQRDIERQLETEALQRENRILRAKLGVKLESETSVSCLPRTPPSVSDSVILEPVDGRMEHDESEADDLSSTGSSPEARVGLKVELI